MEHVKLRRFNKEGLQRMGDFLAFLPVGPPFQADDILYEPNLTEIIDGISVKSEMFENKLAVAEYVAGVLEQISSENSVEQGFWSWLALFHRDQFCRKRRKGNPLHQKKYRWVPDFSDYRKKISHFLYGPFCINSLYKSDVDTAMALLSEKPDGYTRLFKALASRQDLIETKGIMDVITALYYLQTTVDSSLEKGASLRGMINSSSLSIINPSELINNLDQLSLNWDLQAMSCEEIIELMM